MKQINTILALVLLGLMLVGNKSVFAMESPGFSTEEMSQEEIELFLSNINISMFALEPTKEPIKCFDVNENGMIAIGTENSNNKKVCIYSVDGIFQYGFRFKTDGSFGVELENDIVKIYFVRSDVSVLVNSAGEIEGLSKISNTSENNSYWNKAVRKTSKTIGEYEYILKNDIGFLGVFASTYSQLYRVDTRGEEILIYDVNSYQSVHMMIAFVGIIIFVSIVILTIIRQFKKL